MNTTPDARTCSRCGAELAGASGGLCPACVFLLAFGLEPARATEPPLQAAMLRSFGDYELLGEIARGGMGVVFKARHRRLNRTVAVKMVLAGQVAGPVELQRFRAEALAAAHLQHPNIVAIHEVGEHDSLPYFSMEYVEGLTLAQVVQHGPIPADRAAGYVKTIAQAIHYAHQQGVLHRDLKPSNVLIDRFDQPRITDFGLAKRLGSDPNAPSVGTQLTLTGQIIGTPNFMPPEQAAADTKAIGPHSDVYALGAILYFLLTARPPSSGLNLAQTLAHVIETPPTLPRVWNTAVPRDLETICMKCLEKAPQRRYATAEQLADELGRFLSHQPILARPIGRVERTWRWCRRYPAIASLVLSLAITLAAFAAVLGVLEVKQNRSSKGLRPPQAAARPSFQYTGPVQELLSIDEDTLDETRLGLGMNVAIDPHNNQVWCPILVSNAVLVRDGTTGVVVTNLTLADCPGSAVFDPIHRVAWVSAQCGLSSNTNYPSNDLLWALDADAYAVIAGPIYCGGVNGGPEFVNPGTGRFYHDVNGPQRVDPRTFIPTRPAFGVVRAVHPTANLLYAAGPGNVLQILDGAPDPEVLLTNLTLPSAAGTAQLAVNPVLNRLYAGSHASDRILVLDARTGWLEETVTLKGDVGKIEGVRGLAIDPVRNRLFAIAAAKGGQVCYLFAIQGNSQRTRALPGSAYGPLVNPAIGKVYVWVESRPPQVSARQ
jgi:serine/threonine protein kinase/DNA-binding beta-propeller fold protein YncE